MNAIKTILPRAALFVLMFILLCGVIYTCIITGASNLVMADKANGSIIEVDGVKYGSSHLGQQYTDIDHMWGRITNVNATTFTDDEGNKQLYASPSNLSPASDEFEALVTERVESIEAAHPEMANKDIPVDLVTCSGSGLDPDISLAAANYQAERLANNNDISVNEVKDMIKESSHHRFLGVFGEETVNVLEVNLRLDGIL